MKKTTKLTIIAAFCAVVLTAAGFLPAANAAGQDENNFSITKAYLAKHPTMLTKLNQFEGVPDAIVNLGNGKEICYYKIENTMDLGYLTLFIQDGRVIDETLSASLPAAPDYTASLAGR